MRKATADFEAVRAVGREFPDLFEGTMYGSPALKLGKRLVACVAIHRSAEPGSLVVRTDFEHRSALLGRRSGNVLHHGALREPPRRFSPARPLAT